MKTFRFIGMALVTIMICANFIACSSDDDEEEPWYSISEGFTGNPMWVTHESARFMLNINDENSLHEILYTTDKESIEDINDWGNWENGKIMEEVSKSYRFLFNLQPKTTYYYRFYYLRNRTTASGESINETTFGDVKSFTTNEDIENVVDLGLSVKWNSKNLGASDISDIGHYYYWGDTSPVQQAIFSPLVSSMNICGTKHDAATKELGTGWRLPSKEEIKELIEKCTFQSHIYLTSQTEGLYVTGPSGKHLFLPMSGTIVNQASGGETMRMKLTYFGNSDNICFWSGEADVNRRPFYFDSKLSTTNAYWGLPIRPVQE